jgi:hypothetical protein
VWRYCIKTHDPMQLNTFIFRVGLNNSANSPCEPSKNVIHVAHFEAKMDHLSSTFERLIKNTIILNCRRFWNFA